MSELKPCPVTQIQAYRAYEKLLEIMESETDDQTETFNTAYKALYWIVNDYRAQPANEPLTLEQLREMYDEPVWVVCGIYKDWRIPEFIDEGGYKGFIKFTDRSAEPISDYGKTWAAFAHKPGGEQDA